MPAYFTRDTFRFLQDLARHNERAWFEAQKARYLEHVRDPFLRLIADLQEPLGTISAHFRADPRPVGGSLFRPYRDTRFSKDKTPYKTWAGARLGHARGREVEAPVFYLQIAPGDCFVGAGLWHPQPETQRRVRAFLLDNPEAWRRATATPAFRRRYALMGESLVRPPRGVDPAHPLVEDVKRKDFAAGIAFDDATACATTFRRTVVTHLEGLAPLVDYLCAALDLEF